MLKFNNRNRRQYMFQSSNNKEIKNKHKHFMYKNKWSTLICLTRIAKSFENKDLYK